MLTVKEVLTNKIGYTANKSRNSPILYIIYIDAYKLMSRQMSAEHLVRPPIIARESEFEQLAKAIEVRSLAAPLVLRE
jgi:hypothetical protein